MASPSTSPTMTSLSPSPTTVPRRRSKTPSKKTLNPSFADLPSSLLELIMSYLELKDNIRASAACKSWCEAARFVRVVEKRPWLMCFPKRGNLFEFRDPLQWKLYTMDLPELAKSTVCHSRDGWLLMGRSSSNDIFFFNPFSRNLISLPKLALRFQAMAFSCPPTSDNCVLVALKFVTESLVTISTCHPGATEWITEDFPTLFDPLYHTYSKLVYVNDRFYCFNAGGILYYFHPSSRTWNRHNAYELEYPYNFVSWNKKSVFLAENKGELFLMFASSSKKPKVCKLVSLKWEEMSRTKLDGLTIFFSFHNSELRADLPFMRNTFYFSRFGYNRKHCLSYSLDESKYKKYNHCHNFSDLCPLNSLWIDTPKNVLDLF